MEKQAKHTFIGEELKDLAQKIDEVKRENWSLSDEAIDAYLIGKDKGAEDLMNSVIKYYVEKLNGVQVSVENIYHSINQKGIQCQKAYLKMQGLDFRVIFVIADKDFHDLDKRKLCYKISQEEIKRTKVKDILFTYGFTCAEELNIDSLVLSGYNVTFG